MKESAKSIKLLGVLLGVGFGLLRAAKAEGIEGYLVAVGLTVIECAAVMGLDWFAQRHRSVASVYRTSHAQILALEQAIGAIDKQIGDEKSTYARLHEAVRQREMEAFDIDTVAEEAGWAVEACYRAGINANQRLLEGGAVAAYRPER
jgi:hypothetical protein